jgi:phosphohistidine phosphatase SixA
VPLLLVRHASAGHRADWKWDDRDRPLDERGRGQAARLFKKLESFRIERILTSPYLRCVETIAPLAAACGMQPELRGELGVERQATDGIELVRSLVGHDVVICGHGGLEYALPDPPKWKKGMIFVIGPRLDLIRKLRA